MKAMILAAGKGTRVQPITHIIPKPMIPILQKPVISIPLIDYNWGEPSVFKENSCLLINLEQLDKTLEKISTDTVYKNELISNSNSFLTKCFKYRKESSQLIWDYIKNNFH